MSRPSPLSLRTAAALVTLAAAAAVVSCTVAPTMTIATGKQIYGQKCADCHGARGEGVDSKYKEALVGDWSLPRLARYIEKNMPDDHPGTLAPRESEAVAAYVFESFYSPAAQARLHPARIELAHLTNTQYAATIADLIRAVEIGRAHV